MSRVIARQSRENRRARCGVLRDVQLDKQGCSPVYTLAKYVTRITSRSTEWRELREAMIAGVTGPSDVRLAPEIDDWAAIPVWTRIDVVVIVERGLHRLDGDVGP